MKYALQAHLGETNEGRMPWPALGEFADRFRAAGDVLEVEADSVEAALERLYSLANIGTPDLWGGDGGWVRSYRERDSARSLSVGDVIVVNGEMGYVVDSLGFRPVNDHERDALARSASFTA